MTAGETRTDSQLAEPPPHLCRFRVQPYRFLTHQTFTQPSVRKSAANVLEIITERYFRHMY